jgi:hypothetical protein
MLTKLFHFILAGDHKNFLWSHAKKNIGLGKRFLENKKRTFIFVLFFKATHFTPNRKRQISIS